MEGLALPVSAATQSSQYYYWLPLDETDDADVVVGPGVVLGLLPLVALGIACAQDGAAPVALGRRWTSRQPPHGSPRSLL